MATVLHHLSGVIALAAIAALIIGPAVLLYRQERES